MKIRFAVPDRAKAVPELVGVGCFEGGKLSRELSGKKFSGKESDRLYVPSSSGGKFFIGLGKKENYTLEKARLVAARLLAQAKSLQRRAARLDLDSLTEKFSLEEITGAAVEGARLSQYRFDKYKSKPSSSPQVEALELYSRHSNKAAAGGRAISEAETVIEGVFFTRDLANEPANVMTPERLAQAASRMALKNDLKCRVLGLSEIKKLGMGGLVGVSQGSAEAPRFIILENKIKTRSQPVVLVGKGITFDTGGISIKPSNDMDKMKFDMCGAAAVIGTMKVVAHLKLALKVVGLAAVCENMPGSRAQRPGDIIRCLNGKTVEVLNTDAEGRLVLADALSYAARYKPRAIVDIATLTGSCAAALGDIATGVMGTDPDLVKRIREAGDAAGERCWELPLWDDYFDLIKATYADIQNISKKSAGAITAAMFLKEFADHTKSWAHLDIAGTAWIEGPPKPLTPIGATGVGVRLFVRLLKGFLKQ